MDLENLDCGLSPDEQSPYIELETGLQFSSDASFVKSGEIGRIDASLESKYTKPQTTLRYFPDGMRNCYNLSVRQGTCYLIRVTSNYGNYDGFNVSPRFDLYIGLNFWVTMDLERHINRDSTEEIIHIYQTQTHWMYPSDIYDRIWVPYFEPEWRQISTTIKLNNSNYYFVPQDVLMTAAIPANVSARLSFTKDLEFPNEKLYMYFHFSGVQAFQANQTREFSILWNGELIYSPMSLEYLQVDTLFKMTPSLCEVGKCLLELERLKNSTLPPLLSAIEVFAVVNFTQSETNKDDVIAIQNIKTTHGLSRISWQGDPCVPPQFLWDGLTCDSFNVSMPPRITSL
uniref:Malectin-like domain-containing protein n=1 Tax=Brassica oleracea var. oleracea TaxID=109376 RepID=A0A0D3AJI3_BRAOL